MAKGTEWKNVNTVSFTGEIKKLHKSYADANQTAKRHATELRDRLITEWKNKHPNGDGNRQVAAFKVSNGSVQYAMVDAKEVDTGDDIFA